MAKNHACKASCRLVSFALYTSQAQATATVHVALGQIFQRDRTRGYSGAVVSPPAPLGQGVEKTLVLLQPSSSHQHPYPAMPYLSLETFVSAEPQPPSKNVTSHSEQVCIWQNRGKPTPWMHLHRKANMVQSSTERHYNLMKPCDLAMALMVSPTSPPPREGRSTYFIVLELAQGPDSSKMPTRTAPVWQTLHNLLDGDCPLFCRRRAAHRWWGVGNPGTPVILHNKARQHSEKLRWPVSRNPAKKIRSLVTREFASVTRASQKEKILTKG